jgi:hypothetical protein
MVEIVSCGFSDPWQRMIILVAFTLVSSEPNP